MRIIDRLKVELDMLYADLNEERQVRVHPTDDSNFYEQSLPKR